MSGYGQYCPVAKAAEVLGEKWSLLILRELCVAEQSFNSLRRGMPLLSPSLLSKRLKNLAAHGVIQRQASDQGVYYSLSDAGEELRELIMQLGVWGQRWVRSDYQADDLDASLLMWDLHRTMDTGPFPEARRVIQFEFLGAPPRERFYWLVVEKPQVDVCLKNPGYAIDLAITTALKEFTAFWMGDKTLRQLTAEKKLSAEGDASLKRSMKQWLCGSVYAPIQAAASR